MNAVTPPMSEYIYVIIQAHLNLIKGSENVVERHKLLKMKSTKGTK
jgi:hypothetical protein